MTVQTQHGAPQRPPLDGHPFRAFFALEPLRKTIRQADNENVYHSMERRAVLFRGLIAACSALILLFTNAAPLDAYIVRYKEQFYRLYHLHHIQYPDDTMENIYWLEAALAADFCNPLYAEALIENKVQWEKYRYLFMTHINLKLIEQYILLGNKWNKRNAYFYNAPWKEQNLDSLKTAETCYRTALYYWNSAKEWAEKALDKRFRFINLQRVQFWEDEVVRMESGSLDYEKTLNRELALIEKVRGEFEAMNEDTY